MRINIWSDELPSLSPAGEVETAVKVVDGKTFIGIRLRTYEEPLHAADEMAINSITFWCENKSDRISLCGVFEAAVQTLRQQIRTLK